MGTKWNLKSQFLVAIQNGNDEQVSHLLEQGVDPDMSFDIGIQKRPAVCVCVERDNSELLELLIKWGCSINQSDSHGVTPLHTAASHTYEKIVGILIKNRANINAISSLGHTPLHLASQRSSLAIVRMLLNAGAEVDRKDNERKTPLLNACIQGHAEVATYLLERGADVNACSPCGNTPLLFVASSPHRDTVLMERLLAAGAHVDHQNRQGESALHAVLRGPSHKRLRAIDLLHARNCNLNLSTQLGHTPLHLAVLERDDASVTRLVKMGCDVDPKDELELTPLFYLARDRNYDMITLLTAAGAQVRHQRWLCHSRILASLKDPALLVWLLRKGEQCPTLSEFCRLALRSSWGSTIEEKIGALLLPSTLKQYLLLETL